MSIKNTPKISTITISTQLPHCQLNLTNIGKYLSIDDDIIGIKYKSQNVTSGFSLLYNFKISLF